MWPTQLYNVSLHLAVYVTHSALQHQPSLSSICDPLSLTTSAFTQQYVWPTQPYNVSLHLAVYVTHSALQRQPSLSSICDPLSLTASAVSALSRRVGALQIAIIIIIIIIYSWSCVSNASPTLFVLHVIAPTIVFYISLISTVGIIT